MDYQSIHLDPGENVLLEVRKHWIVFAGNALVLFFGALLPLAVYTILQIFVPNILKMIVLPGNGAALVSFHECRGFLGFYLQQSGWARSRSYKCESLP
jgi:hypothetical protein